MKKQIWLCESCGKWGEILYDDNESDLMSVVNKIADNHKSKSPDCDYGYRDLRIIVSKYFVNPDGTEIIDN